MLEKKAWKLEGFLSILLSLGFTGGGVLQLISENIFLAVVLFAISSILFSSIVIVKPNQSVVLTFFGRYVGSVRNAGIWMTVPFTEKRSISLKVNNFTSKTLKVNDIEGNPIEIGAVVVYRVIDSAKAMFDVEDYDGFVEIQSETALRHVATKYPYDNFEDDGISLRGDVEKIANELTADLQDRLQVAGVEVLEARLTHLAYATEIASAMLQRQQASAIVAARQKIVEGAVGMAQLAIELLEKDGTVKLDEERKFAMINNLMVSIVCEKSTQPVVNTGTIY